MLTVRATALESYRLYADPDCDFITTEEIEARLLGLEPRPDAEALARMERGTAFHSAVEDCSLDYEPDDGAVVHVNVDRVVNADDFAASRTAEYAFAARTIYDARAGLGCASEVEGSTILDVYGVPVRLTGHADWLRGLDGWDIKTSSKPIPADRHAGSMQWRAYCLLFGLQRFTYRHVYLAEDRQGVIYARSIEDVTVYPYPRLRDDVVSCLGDLLAFAEIRGCLDAMRCAA